MPALRRIKADASISAELSTTARIGGTNARRIPARKIAHGQPRSPAGCVGRHVGPREAHMTTTERTMTSLRRRAVLAMAVSAIAFAGAAKAQAADLVDLTVVDRETGQPARVWRQGGRLFVAGRPGARYSLRVTNNTEGRVLVVMS